MKTKVWIILYAADDKSYANSNVLPVGSPFASSTHLRHPLKKTILPPKCAGKFIMTDLYYSDSEMK